MKVSKQQKRIRRHNRVRAKIQGTAQMPRLCVFRSNQHITAQIIDDQKGRTIILAKDTEIKSKIKSPASAKAPAGKQKSEELSGKIAAAFEVGKQIAKLAAEKKITKVVFDRGGYKYHGRVKALAEGAREGGLIF